MPMFDQWFSSNLNIDLRRKCLSDHLNLAVQYACAWESNPSLHPHEPGRTARVTASVEGVTSFSARNAADNFAWICNRQLLPTVQSISSTGTSGEVAFGHYVMVNSSLVSYVCFQLRCSLPSSPSLPPRRRHV